MRPHPLTSAMARAVARRGGSMTPSSDALDALRYATSRDYCPPGDWIDEPPERTEDACDGCGGCDLCEPPAT